MRSGAWHTYTTLATQYENQTKQHIGGSGKSIRVRSTQHIKVNLDGNTDIIIEEVPEKEEDIIMDGIPDVMVGMDQVLDIIMDVVTDEGSFEKDDGETGTDHWEQFTDIIKYEYICHARHKVSL